MPNIPALWTTFVCLISEQALLSKQVLNSTVLPAPFLSNAYVVANKQAGWVKNWKIVKRACSAISQMIVHPFRLRVWSFA